MNDSLGISLLVAVVALILKALWDLKTQPNGADVKRATDIREQLERRLQQMEADLRFVRDRVLEGRQHRRKEDDTYEG